jgi:FG-GAP-like repeat
MKRAICFLFLVSVFVTSCGGDKVEEPVSVTPPGTVKAPVTVTNKMTPGTSAASGELTGKSLIVTQSEFKADEKGQYTVPDKAVMLILRQQGSRFNVERIEDTESNVFHKALAYGDEGILTIGANEALLKMWTKTDGKWSAKELWHPTFGGKHNRLRDIEIADFNGDGTDDLAIATHDQGVIAVVWRRGDAWEPEELDRQANTFVHEIEIGDLDGDGKKEFYSTPSEPNTVSGKNQGGKVVRFSWTGEKFEKSDVVVLETRHIKEIMIEDLDGDGKQELYAAVEAETDGMKITAPVEIRRFDLVDGKFNETIVTKIDDRFCRFLVAGDVDHDGKKELVATAFSSGVWVIEKEGDAYTKKCIDAKSGGFEHSSYITDLDGDGKQELYVADDRSGSIRRYFYENGKYTTKVLNRRLIPGQAMSWNITAAELK